MNIDKMIEQWEEKHSSLLDEYSKGNANNEVMQMYRSQMKNVLDFINQLKQVKNCSMPDIVLQSEQLVCDCTHTQVCKICAKSKDIDWDDAWDEEN
jgi:Zn-dependent M32 family carboxypeptidase